MEDRVESLAAENEHLHTQLEAAEAEVERLSVALGDESTCKASLGASFPSGEMVPQSQHPN